MTSRMSFHVEAPVETVYDFFASGTWTQVALMKVHDIHLTKEGTGTNYVWDARVGPLKMEGLSVWTDVRPNEHITERTTGPMPAIWEHSFEPEGRGTRYTLEVHPRSFLSLPGIRTLVEKRVSRMGEQLAPRVRARLEVPA